MKYKGKNINVSFNTLKCTHEAECLKILPSVFDLEKTPWVNVDAASADEIEKAVMACPTGALHFERLDGAEQEPIPETNSITVGRSGPLFVRGNIEVTRPGENDVISDTRMALCRCGTTHRKYCDEGHKSIEFSKKCDLSPLKTHEATEKDDGKIRIKVILDGPYVATGTFDVIVENQKQHFERAKVFLCSCGLSDNAPFCDGSHLNRDSDPTDE